MCRGEREASNELKACLVGSDKPSSSIAIGEVGIAEGIM